MMVSVCMATYNGEKYIARQLESILCQLDSSDEIIISDDNSTDSTLLIIKMISDARIKVFINEGVSGPMGNFEQAFLRASGDYILLADQDDYWLPQKVHILSNILKYNDLVLSNCQVVDKQGTILYPSFFTYRKSKPGFWRNLYRNSYIGCCMAFRREVLSYALPIPPKVHMHDWWIGLLAEAKGKVCFYPQPLIQYVRHGENASPTGEVGYNLTKRIENRLTMLWYVTKRLVIQFIKKY
ncbi:glycosyltransferase family 2 protein [Spirosoma pulveris]